VPDGDYVDRHERQHGVYDDCKLDKPLAQKNRPAFSCHLPPNRIEGGSWHVIGQGGGSWAHGGETPLLHLHVIPASSPEVDGSKAAGDGLCDLMPALPPFAGTGSPQGIPSSGRYRA
jgi:hypothetical protein